jgi:hypothetical protein
VVNRSTFRVSFAWGSVRSDRADGSKWLRPGQRAVITVRRRSIVWVAASDEENVRVAHAVRGISLPRGTKELPPGAPTGHHVPDHFPGDGNSDNDFGRVSAAWLR